MKPFTNSTTYKDTKYECMQLVSADAGYAYDYAYSVLKKRWADVGRLDIEDVIGTHASWAYLYARNVLKKRWADIGKPEVEDVIKKSYVWEYYKRHFGI